MQSNHHPKHVVQLEDGSSKTGDLKAITASLGDENRCPRSLSLNTESDKLLGGFVACEVYELALI